MNLLKLLLILATLVGAIIPTSCSEQPTNEPRKSKTTSDDDDDKDDKDDKDDVDDKKQESNFGPTGGSGGKTGSKTGNIDIDRYSFDYKIETPESYDEDDASCIVFFFHGTPTSQQEGWWDQVNRDITSKDCIAVMPMAPMEDAWGGDQDKDLLKVGIEIESFIQKLGKKYNFDKSKVTLFGYSAGANLVVRALVPLMENYKGTAIVLAGGTEPGHSTVWFESDKPKDQWVIRVFAASADTFNIESREAHDYFKAKGFDSKYKVTSNTMHNNYELGAIAKQNLAD